MAGRRTHVPKFGNWDANDHVPYTTVFDQARQGRGKPINPNDPSENPSIFGNGAPDDSMESPDLQQDKVQRSRPTSQGSREGNSRGQPPQQPHQVAEGTAARRVAVPSAQSDNGPPSRVPPDPPTRVGAAFPARENIRKSTGEDGHGQTFAPATQNRSRRPTGVSNANRQEAATKGPSGPVPNFGNWDDQDPATGDAYTAVFNKAINEKRTGGLADLKRAPEHEAGDDDLYQPSRAGTYQKGRRQGSKILSWFSCLEPVVKSKSRHGG